MGIAAAFVLAAATAGATPGDAQPADHGAEVEKARVSVTILRPAVLRDGAMASNANPDAPRAQRHDEGRRVTYTFE